MRKNPLMKLAVTTAAAMLSMTVLSACSALGQAPTVINEESSLHQEDTSVQDESGSENSETAHGDSASGSRLDDILKRGYIEVATEPYFAPMSSLILPSRETRNTSVLTLSLPNILRIS